jgi:hypothetical protein
MLVGRRRVGQIDPVVGLVYFRLEAKTVLGHRREGERVIYVSVLAR